MTGLSRRSLFAGMAALPALAPSIVAARPFATGGVVTSLSVISEGKMSGWDFGRQIAYGEFHKQLDAAELQRIHVAFTDFFGADFTCRFEVVGVDDRAFGFEG